MTIDHQLIARGGGEHSLNKLLEEAGVQRPFLLCDGAFPFLPCAEWKIAAAPCFRGVSPNPVIEDVRLAIAAYRASGCDGIVAVGGGSAIDTAKGVKAFHQMPAGDELRQPLSDTGLPLIAIPTTAGTGSESTQFAVIYEGGVKHSVSHPSLRPAAVLLEGELLRTLPPYQKKATLMDALCQGIESHWSRRATAESRALAERAIAGILENLDAYLAGDPAAAQRMLESANLSGQAINLTTTTAPHAMSYKLTSLYHIAHGHAVALCLPGVWRYMAAHGDDDLRRELDTLSGLLGGGGAEVVAGLNRRLGLNAPQIAPEQLDILAAAVNPQRLSNNPLPLDADALRGLYAALASDA